MQIFVLVHEEKGIVVTIPAKSEKDAVKQLAEIMFKHNRDEWSHFAADYWIDIDDGVWTFYDGPTDVTISRPFMAFIRNFA